MKLYLLGFVEANCPYGEEPFEENFILCLTDETVSDEKAVKLLSELAVEVRERKERYDDRNDELWESMGWNEKVCATLDLCLQMKDYVCFKVIEVKQEVTGYVN